MAESHSIVKIAIFVGMAFVLIAAFNPSAGAAWTNFQNSIQGFPQFDNPFNQRVDANFSIVNDGSVAPTSVTNNGVVPFCTTSATPVSNWWGCVVQKDAGTSYLSQNNIAQGRVKMANVQGGSGSLPVIGVTITAQCRGSGADRTFDVFIRKADDATPVGEWPNQVLTCHAGIWENVTATTTLVPVYPIVSDFNAGTVAFNPSGLTDFSYLSIRLILGTTTQCTTGNSLDYIGCSISGFFNFAVKIAVFAFNILLFFGAIVIYFVNIIGQFIGLFAYFFSIPGMPTILQSILTVLFIGVTLFVILAILGKVRGSGSGT